MYNIVLLKYAEHPWLHNWPIDSSDMDETEGKLWDCRAVIGSWGLSSKAVWVDCILALFGNITCMPDCVGDTPVTERFMWMHFIRICKK